ncbi:transmembrane protein 168-like protein [Lates japonicus]|uniref:Transmembrane protein 168-like protein n=1 Tax=Lates japonicus TaxID=270547 RepID=A0AAD3NMF1_LATJO|nr:transmembrane protein 168-like protein [Lates japonicus]
MTRAGGGQWRSEVVVCPGGWATCLGLNLLVAPAWPYAAWRGSAAASHLWYGFLGLLCLFSSPALEGDGYRRQLCCWPMGPEDAVGAAEITDVRQHGAAHPEVPERWYSVAPGHGHGCPPDEGGPGSSQLGLSPSSPLGSCSQVPDITTNLPASLLLLQPAHLRPLLDVYFSGSVTERLAAFLVWRGLWRRAVLLPLLAWS